MTTRTQLEKVEETEEEASGNNRRFFPIADDDDGELFGRSDEREQFLRAYRRVREEQTSKATEFVVITGGTGAGKTALAHSIRSTVLQDGGFFAAGKFDQLQLPAPYGAFAGALAGLGMNFEVRHDSHSSSLRESHWESFTEPAASDDALAIMSPEIGSIAEVQDEMSFTKPEGSNAFTTMSSEMSSIAEMQDKISDAINKPNSEQRFKEAVHAFFMTVSSRERPLVLLLDDLHWADAASLDLLKSLLLTTSKRCVLFVGTYRDCTKQLSAFLSQVEGHKKVALTTIGLQYFEEAGVNNLVSRALGLPEDRTASLSSVVFSQTRGQVFFVLQFLYNLKERGLLVFEASQNQWEWDAQEISLESDNFIYDFIHAKIAHGLPVKVQEALKVSACFGWKINVAILKLLMSDSVLPSLRLAAERGVIRTCTSSPDDYEFSHDIFQEAAYNLIEAKGRKSFHFKIGLKLWKRLSVEEIDNSIFTVLGQLMFGKDLMGDEKQRLAVASLCLRAGQRAIQLSNFETAVMYCEHGISLLGLTSWRDNYSLTLTLHIAAAEVAYCNGDLEKVHRFVDDTIKNAASFEDTLTVRSTQVHALGTMGHVEEAIQKGIGVLKELGEKISPKPSLLTLYAALAKTRSRLAKKSDESLLRLPVMEAGTKPLSLMQAMNILIPSVMLGDVNLAFLICLRMVNLTLDHGLCAVSSVGFAVFGLALCSGNDIGLGYRCGQLAMRIYERFKVKSLYARVAGLYYTGILAWKKPSQDIIKGLRYACQIGLESGDVEFAFADAWNHIWLELEIEPLRGLFREICQLEGKMESSRQTMNQGLLRPLALLVQVLVGDERGDGESSLSGSLQIPDGIAKSELNVWWTAVMEMIGLYMFGDYPGAEEHFEASSSFLKVAVTPYDIACVSLFQGLTALAQSNKARRTGAAMAKKHIKKLRQAAMHIPVTFLGKQFLLEAELAAVRENHRLAATKYTCAIALSREAGFLMTTALANERFCKHLLKRDERYLASPYYEEAILLYTKWGATAKANHLKTELAGEIFGHGKVE